MRQLNKPAKLLGYKQLSATRGIPFSRTHLARLEADNKFPRRVQLGAHRVGWVETEIDEWLADKLAARDHLVD
jgi:prophage regulatory protein